MSDRQDDLNPASDLAPFADALQRLAPQAVQLSRDALLFEAGKAAAAPKLAGWVWPTATGGFAALSLVMASFMFSPGPAPRYVERVQYVNLPAAEPSAEPPPATAAAPAPAIDEARSLEKALQTRRDVYRWGIDMLPEAKPAGGGQAPGAARDVIDWLNLPRGTYASPVLLRPKKIEENDE